MKSLLKLIIVLPFAFTICFWLNACNGKHEKKNTHYATSINFTFEEDSIPSDEIFDFSKTSFIRLETNENCLVSEITQMNVFNDKIFILDKNLNSVYSFNTSGKFRNKIGSIGNGPGEFIRPRYFFINKNDSTINIFDAPNKKVNSYNFDGHFIKEIRMNCYLRAIGALPNGNLWGFCANKTNESIGSQFKKYTKFIVFNPDGSIDSHIQGNKSIDNCNISPSYLVSDIGGSLSYMEPYLPYIFTLDNDELKIKYKIEFSRYPLPDKLARIVEKIEHPLDSNEKKQLAHLMNEYPVIFTSFFETDTLLLLHSSLSKVNIYGK